jgi:hypothetical protein
VAETDAFMCDDIVESLRGDLRGAVKMWLGTCTYVWRGMSVHVHVHISQGDSWDLARDRYTVSEHQN